MIVVRAGCEAPEHRKPRDESDQTGFVSLPILPHDRVGGRPVTDRFAISHIKTRPPGGRRGRESGVDRECGSPASLAGSTANSSDKAEAAR